MSTFLHYVHCKDALLDCSAPGGERCESLTWVDEIGPQGPNFSEILIKNLRLFIHGNAYENMVCEMAAILSGRGRLWIVRFGYDYTTEG